MPKTPEQWLERAAEKKAGILKLFLGYAPGVGKTYTMLSEAIRRKSRGEDVVIGVVETHGRKAVGELAASLESVPLRKLEYKGTVFEEMDTDRILSRGPQIALVDEMAHTNIEGSKHRKRYEDVMELLDANVHVLSTMNIQHVDSLAPLVQSIAGIAVRETIPDWVLKRASEVVMIDLTPEALQNRLRRGDIYALERVDHALGNFFRSGNLNALRELALRQVAESVDRNLESYLETQNIRRSWGVRERVAVCIDSRPTSQYLIARASRVARAIDAELLVVHVETREDEGDERKRRNLEANLRFAKNLEAEVVRLKGDDVAETVAQFVKERRVTQVVFGHSAPRGWRRYLSPSTAQRFLRDAPPVDVHIVTQENDDQN